MRESGGGLPVADDGRTALELAELRHRTDNLLQTIQSLLHLEAKRAEAAESTERMRELALRIDLLVGLHRRLNALGQGEELDAGELVRDTAAAVVAPHEERIALECEVAKLPLDARRAQSLALLVNEAVTNVTRHAFDPGEGGRVLVRLRRSARGGFRVVVLDNGRGLRREEGSEGFGIRLMRGLALNLGAELSLEPGSPGLKLTLRVPPRLPAGTDDGRAKKRGQDKFTAPGGAQPIRSRSRSHATVAATAGLRRKWNGIGRIGVTG